MEVIWKGNQQTNSSSRNGHIPFVIVNHISVGSMSSMDAWFTDPGNRVSSAHYGVAKDGRIHQYVRLERAAWAQGIELSQIANATAQVVKDMNVNPNLYCVSIEHEGYNGDLTEAQFQSSLRLHRHIREAVYDRWGLFFPLDRYHVIGHHQVNPKGKPFCPGPMFPWERLYDELKKGEDAMFEQLKQQVAELQQENRGLSERLARLENLHRQERIPEWAQEAVDKAVASGLVNEPEQGSYDFYRFITVLHRKGLLG